MAKIEFRFEEKGLENVVVENVTVGDSILDIADNNGIELNDNCGRVCACSTCHVYIIEGGESLDEITDTEEDMIDRAINPSLDSRLGCQCEILKDTKDLVVIIPDQHEIIGHDH